eukprot:TRINITY_DN9447_c0_g1_i2.p1 TRINITY_DN9447_c0_g1~~TRINITY_DN9447_c0_g1_i2.p1  ORF type:complete len:288 (+),score=63.89 TRINITY_DN9447_c0_g1_i2:261-1124(+)
MLDTYWDTVSARFNNSDGVLFYEIMNEPWAGDIVEHPSLLLEAGKAEQGPLGSFMQRMHGIIRKNDPDTMVLYSPAEVNNRLMRKVGYQTGFLPGEPMTFHTYCITGTDGPGPTTPKTIALCHFNDGFQLKQRESDLKRLKTAGIVTEFGAVAGVPTGLAEVKFVAEHFDAASPPLSWAFWNNDEVSSPAYIKELSRAHPQAVAGDLTSFSFDSSSAAFTLNYKSADAVSSLTTDVFLGALQYPNGWTVTTSPEGCCTVTNTADGISIVANKPVTDIQVGVIPKAAE